MLSSEFLSLHVIYFIVIKCFRWEIRWITIIILAKTKQKYLFISSSTLFYCSVLFHTLARDAVWWLRLINFLVTFHLSSPMMTIFSLIYGVCLIRITININKILMKKAKIISIMKKKMFNFIWIRTQRLWYSYPNVFHKCWYTILWLSLTKIQILFRWLTIHPPSRVRIGHRCHRQHSISINWVCSEKWEKYILVLNWNQR